MKPPKLLYGLLILLFVVVLTRAALTPLFGYFLKRGLEDAGFSRVVFHEIHLNVFRSSIEIKQLKAFYQVNTEINLSSLRVDFQWRDLLEGRLAVVLLAVDGLRVAQQSDEPLTLATDLEVNGLSLADGAVAVTGLRLENVELTSATQPLLQLQQAHIGASRWSPNSLEIGVIELSGLQAELRRDQQGRLHLLPAAGANSEQSGPVLVWRLAGIIFSGDNYLNWRDATTQPAANLRLRLDQLTVGALDSEQPQQPTSLQLQAGLDSHSKIVLEGSFSPLAETPQIALQTRVEHLDINAFSPYISATTGYRATTGQVYLQSDVQVSDGRIHSDNQLRINHLNVEQDDPERAAQLAKLIPLPLDMALDLIRDKQDDIVLELPVSGALDSPDFAVQAVIQKALAKALQGASMAYLKYAIQPWGAVWMVGEKLTERAGHIAFDPLVFQPGDSRLDKQAGNYLATLATLLQEKPFLRLTFCPITNAADSEYLAGAPGAMATQEQLSALGAERAALVKQRLVDVFEISPGRLFSCPPSHQPKQLQPLVRVVL